MSKIIKEAEMSKISAMCLPEFGFHDYMIAIVGNVTEIIEDLFGRGFIRNAWLVMSFYDTRPGRFREPDYINYNKEYFESLLKKQEDHYWEHRMLQVDEDELLIEFINDKKILIKASEWFNISKPKELK